MSSRVRGGKPEACDPPSQITWARPLIWPRTQLIYKDRKGIWRKVFAPKLWRGKLKAFLHSFMCYLLPWRATWPIVLHTTRAMQGTHVVAASETPISSPSLFRAPLPYRLQPIPVPPPRPKKAPPAAIKPPILCLISTHCYKAKMIKLSHMVLTWVHNKWL